MPIETITRQQIELDVKNILDRPDLTSYIQLWFWTAHRALQRMHNFKCMERTAYETIVLNTHIYAEPDDLKKPIFLYLYDATTKKIYSYYTEVDLLTFRGEKTYSDTVDNETLISNLYTRWDNAIHLYPTPGSDIVQYQLRLDYYAWLPAPSGPGFDWFTTHARDFLTYRTLLESAAFIEGDARLVQWQKLADRLFTEIVAPSIDIQTAGLLEMRG